MKTLDLKQGSEAWLQHRRSHFNASDAPAMLGCSPYKTRAQLLHEMHTGLAPEIDVATAKRFENGHRVETLARPLAEEFIGEELYPVTGTEGKLSASFDGLTLEEDTAFEHKALSSELKKCFADMETIAPEHREASSGKCLAKHYRAQMEQQLLVSGAKRVLFMSSNWDGEELIEEHHCWYYPDPALRAEIVAGWKQFAEDLAAYEKPAAAAPAPIAASVQALPAVSVIVDGSIAIRENFDAFETAARDFLQHRLIREPKTDQDFADLEVQIKAMKGAEAALDAAEEGWIAQIEPVSRAKRRKDMLRALVRDNRLMAEKLLGSEKERRRGEIVAGAVGALQKHVAGLNQRLGKPYMPAVPADFAGCIRGLKSLASMEDKVAAELARAKAASTEIASTIQTNLAALRELAGDHAFLFADTASLVLKAPDDCRATITSRIGEHRQAEEKRLEAERQRIRAEEEARAQRQRIRAEEEARAQRQQQEREAAERRQAQEAAAAPVPALSPAPAPIASPAVVTQAPAVVSLPTRTPAGPPTLRIGEIANRLGFGVTEAFLRLLGFVPSGKEGASKLFHEHEWPAMCDALIEHVQAARDGAGRAAA